MSNHSLTPSPAQPTQSAAQVFATTELLEKILISLQQVKHLMKTRRVCHRWQDVIDGTESLKKKMWLAPQQLDHEWYLSASATELRKRPVSTAAADGDVSYKSACINPFLFFTKSEPPIWKSHFHNCWVSQPLYLHEQPQSTSRKAKSLFLKIFATQPPVTVLYLRTTGEHGQGPRNYGCLVQQIKNKKGMKVGDVLRAARTCLSARNWW